MESILRPIYQERASRKETLAVLLLEKNKPHSSWTDHFDAVLIIIVEESDREWFAKHYEYEGKKAAMHIVTENQLVNWLSGGRNRRVIHWVLNGKVIFERNEYIENLRESLREFPEDVRQKKINTEFAKLVRSYSIGRDLYESKEFFDAYNQMVRSLHHLARLAVMEQGFHPEVTVWNQIKQIEPEIYKLYKELIESGEPLDKRIELLLIASGFAIRARTEEGNRHFLKLLRSKEEPWTFGELIEHEELQDYALDLGVLVEHLVEKGIVAVVNEPTKGKDVYHRTYQYRKDI
ncbi:nucleotidyltransferase-like protein [Bacillus tianshenii]|nr:nucleotidyltransferase-like protein [Bacillus tianshenii]